MGKPKIEIQFDNPGGHYSAGQRLQGLATITSPEPLSLRGIRIKFKGKAKVRWVEGSGDGRKTYSAKEVYFKSEALLFGKLPQETNDTSQLGAGTHEFPFQFQLPVKLPSSFQGEHGSVFYYVKIIIDKPLAVDPSQKVYFQMHRHLDLNQQPAAMREFIESKEKRLCCLCCESGPLSGTVHLKRLGYVLGEAVPVFGEVTNLTSRAVECSLVLYMKVEYHAKQRSRSDRTEVAREECPTVTSGDSWQLTGQPRLTIPTSLVPSFLADCSLMDVSYTLAFVADPSGPAMELKIPMEILIGTIPHRLAQPL